MSVLIRAPNHNPCYVYHIRSDRVFFEPHTASRWLDLQPWSKGPANVGDRPGVWRKKARRQLHASTSTSCHLSTKGHHLRRQRMLQGRVFFQYTVEGELTEIFEFARSLLISPSWSFNPLEFVRYLACRSFHHLRVSPFVPCVSLIVQAASRSVLLFRDRCAIPTLRSFLHASAHHFPPPISGLY